MGGILDLHQQTRRFAFCLLLINLAFVEKEVTCASTSRDLSFNGTRSEKKEQ